MTRTLNSQNNNLWWRLETKISRNIPSAGSLRMTSALRTKSQQYFFRLQDSVRIRALAVRSPLSRSPPALAVRSPVSPPLFFKVHSELTSPGFRTASLLQCSYCSAVPPLFFRVQSSVALDSAVLPLFFFTLYLSDSVVSPLSVEVSTIKPMENETETVNELQIVETVGESNASTDSDSTTNNIESEPGSKKRKMVKERSMAWRYFNKFTDSEGVKKARCKFCSEEYVADTKHSGTSNLLLHIPKCPTNPYKAEGSQTTLGFQPQGLTGDVSVIPWKFDQEACRRALARMIIKDELPFISVEKDGFRDFVRSLQPLFHIPSRTTMTRDCLEIYHEARLALKSILKESKQRICITTDTWTSIQRINYMCVTAHYIDNNWKLHKRILNFCPITSHKGQDLASGIAKCLLEWGVDKVFTVTVDNASSNDVMVRELSKQFTRWNTNLMEGKHVHVRCMAHIINLVVQDGLRDGSVSVERIRQAVRYIRQSPARWKKFKECCDLDRITSKKSLCLDVPTRWNSTYLMLKVATVYEEAFTKYCDIDYGLMSCISNCICEDGQPAGPLLSSDWDSVRRIVKFLEIFYELTLKVSGTLYITSNVHFLEICVVDSSLKELMQNEDAFLREMAKNMKEKFDKYWGDPHKMNKMIFISCVLDPRHKFNTLSFALGSMFGETVGLKIQEDVKTYMDTLFNVYPMKNGGSGSCPSTSSPSSPSSGPSSPSSSSLLSKFMLDLKQHKKCGGVDSKTELDKYLGEDVEEDHEKFNILGWWKLNSPRFPTLAEMARDVLAIPISSVASESAFSTGGRIHDPFRSSLTPRFVQAL
uniref:Zinc finger BED domain-containing protein RICESLEEPER 2-like n=1 Tax=Nicotiana sylvestris TaxID=4096 RepID=A0A1U7XB00_NICSY